MQVAEAEDAGDLIDGERAHHAVREALYTGGILAVAASLRKGIGDSVAYNFPQLLRQVKISLHGNVLGTAEDRI
jgi:hypothetical protein